MSALPTSRRLLAVLVGLISAFYIHVAVAAPIGTVTKAQNQVQIGSSAAAVGTPVNMNDRLRTGANARMEVTFHDGTKLTLGENANVVIDRYVYNPAQSTGALALKSATGAMRFSTGKINQMRNKKVTVTTPYAALAVRGTEFWMGPIDGHYGTLLLKGKVAVRSAGGEVALDRPGWGTDIRPRRRR
jgi:hypothetical protein